MEYRTLGRSGLRVSPLCLGSMMFGGATDEPTAARIVARAREQGVNFIDTADGYNAGRSEEIVGRSIREHRSWWVLATKCANPTGEVRMRAGSRAATCSTRSRQACAVWAWTRSICCTCTRRIMRHRSARRCGRWPT